MKWLLRPLLSSAPTSWRVPRVADRFRWEFDWPAEVLVREQECSTFEFARWLRKDGVNARFSRRELISRYAEFVDLTETCPMTGWHRFDLSLKPAGIVRTRSSTGARPWLYRVEPLQPSLTLKQPRRPSP